MKKAAGFAVCFVLTAICLICCAAAAGTGTITLSDGVYNVGRDIPAGEYEILCTEASDPYHSYMDMMKSLSDDDSLQALFSFYDGLADDPAVTVTIRGTSGETEKQFTLEKNAKRNVTLKDDYSIKIEDGACALELKKEIAPSSGTGSVRTQSAALMEWICPGCGSPASGNFCSNCGAAKPEGAETTGSENPEPSGNEDITGIWPATEIIYNGVSLDISNTDVMRAELRIRADGKVILAVNGDEDECSWTRPSDSVIEIHDGSNVYSAVFENGKITLETEELTIVFSRESAASVSRPVLVSAESENEFLGEWHLSRAVIQGMEVTPFQFAALGYSMDMTMTISSGKARIDVVSKGKQDYNEFTTSFSGGRLVLKSRYNRVSMTLLLSDSGEIYTTVDLEDTSYPVYFVRNSGRT